MRLHGASVEYRAFSQASEALLEALEQIESAATQIMPNLSPGERLRLLRRMLEGTRLFPEMTEAHALRLLGWLELLWEPAPALLIGGMNEGKVPESITADAWLPHSLRAALGLRTNDDRLARDAYLLTALQQSRMQPAGLRLYASRVSLANEPLKPSRLLLACTRVDLPARVAQLFPAQAEHLSEEGQSPIWQRGWKLLMPRFDDFPIPLKFSVTYFRNYLDCPFRYFLRHREKMEKQDLLDDEPDARSFGNFVHDALMLMAKDNSINRCDDVHKLADYLEDAVHDILKLRFGSQLSVPLLIHRQAAINRLRAAAAVHVESRRQGWHILSAESSLREELGRAWSLDAVEICGRIDLIEQHEGTGAWRILDYKTASRAKTPQDAHLADLGRNENLPDWRLHEGQKWIDLQLPLYVLAMREKLGPQGSAAYINLPAAVGAIRLEPWEALGSEKILTSAKNCACAVLRLIRERKFWPPSEKPSFDDYTGLYFKPEKLAEAFDYQAYPSDLGL
jgi:ATP-dependent helicase/nuclease subunit B